MYTAENQSIWECSQEDTQKKLDNDEENYLDSQYAFRTTRYNAYWSVNMLVENMTSEKANSTSSTTSRVIQSKQYPLTDVLVFFNLLLVSNFGALIQNLSKSYSDEMPYPYTQTYTLPGGYNFSALISARNVLSIAQYHKSSLVSGHATEPVA
jgi:hypothetical protein